MQGLHIHDRMQKDGSSDMNYDFKNSHYQKIDGKAGDLHIRYQ